VLLFPRWNAEKSRDYTVLSRTGKKGGAKGPDGNVRLIRRSNGKEEATFMTNRHKGNTVERNRHGLEENGVYAQRRGEFMGVAFFR